MTRTRFHSEAQNQRKWLHAICASQRARSAARALFLSILIHFAAAAAIAFSSSQIAHAHNDNCTTGQVQPADGGACLPPKTAEFYDWCNNLQGVGQNGQAETGRPQYDDIFSEHNCRIPYSLRVPTIDEFCLSQGQDVTNDDSRCAEPDQSSCTTLNNGRAEYVFGPTQHECQCTQGSVGNAAAGECGCPAGQFPFGNQCHSPGDACPTQQNAFVDSDGTCKCNFGFHPDDSGQCQQVQCPQGKLFHPTILTLYNRNSPLYEPGGATEEGCHFPIVIEFAEWAENKGLSSAPFAWDKRPAFTVPQDGGGCAEAGFHFRDGDNPDTSIGETLSPGTYYCHVGNTLGDAPIPPSIVNNLNAGCKKINNNNAEFIFAPTSRQCQCNTGYSGDAAAGQCIRDYNPELLAEIRQANPDLVSIRAMLSLGANPNHKDENGDPILKIAVTRELPLLMSILITAGAKPAEVKFRENENGNFANIAHYFALNGSGPRTPWATALTMLVVLGDAIDSTSPPPEFNWNHEDAGGHTPPNYLQHRFDGNGNANFSPNESDDAAMLKIAAYLRHKGARCTSHGGVNPDHITCADDGPQCPGGNNVWSCSRQCPAAPIRSHNAVVSLAAEDSTSCVASCPNSGGPAVGRWLENTCPDDRTPDLLAEIRKPNPSMDSVLALLPYIHPNSTDENGDTALKAAVTLGLPQVISVLITAGAEPQSVSFGLSAGRHTRIHHYLTQNQQDSARRFEWGLVVTMFLALDGGISMANPAPAVDWNSRDADNHRALNYLQHRLDGGGDSTFSPAEEDNAAILLIAAFLRGKNAECVAHGGVNINHITCTDLGPMCPETGANVFSCSRLCPQSPLRSTDSPANVKASETTSCVASCQVGRVPGDSKWLETACICSGGGVIQPDGSCACPPGEEYGDDGVCFLNPLNVLLVDELNREGPGESPCYANCYANSDPPAVLASVIALLNAGANPDASHTGEGDGVPLSYAGLYGYAEVVSVLLTAGADPNGAHANRNAVQHAARKFRSNHTRGESVTRHFIAGLHQRGIRNFNWNANNNGGIALNHIADQFENNQSSREMAALIYERGGRCGSGKVHEVCAAPSENVNGMVGGQTGDVYTITARDFGGDEFNLELPDSDSLAALADSGWTLHLRSQSRPYALVAARTRPRRDGDIAAFFNFSARAVNLSLNNNQVVRRYRVSLFNPALYADIAPPDAPDLSAAPNPVVDYGVQLQWTRPFHRGAPLASWILQGAAADSDDCDAHSFAPADYADLPQQPNPADLALDYSPPAGDRGKCLSFRIAARNEAGTGAYADAANITVGVSPLGRLQDAVTDGDAARAREALAQIPQNLRGNLASAAGNPLIPEAAQRRHAQVVSVLAAGGVDPNAENFANGRNLAHLVARDSGAYPAEMLAVLRHFLAALHESQNQFTGWNDATGIGRPLNALQTYADESSPQAREIHALFYASGARCSGAATGDYCQIPRFEHSAPADAAANHIGPVLTVFARDGYGLEFDLAADENELTALTNSGWNLQLLVAPYRAILSRARAMQSGDAPATFRLTMRDLSGEPAALLDGFAYFELADGESIRLVLRPIGGGQLTAVDSDGAPLASGDAVESGDVITITATPDSFVRHVSGWGGACASAAGDIYGGAATCVVTVDANDSNILAEATFTFGRLPSEIVEGNLNSMAEREAYCNRWGTLIRVAGVGSAVFSMCANITPGTPKSPSNVSDFSSGRCRLESRNGWYLCRPMFLRIRECNKLNMRGVAFNQNCVAGDANSAGCPVRCEPCGADEIAFGDDCRPASDIRDQCDSNPCVSGQTCLDSDIWTDNALNSVCTSSVPVDDAAGAKLAEAVRTTGVNNAVRVSVAAEVRTQLAANADPNYNANEGAVVALAAQRRNWLAVSILLTAGANPDGRAIANRSVLHHVGRASDNFSADMLEVLRHFLAGINGAGRIDIFDELGGWNAGADVGRPLDALNQFGANTDATREIHRLLYERGARCASPGNKTRCQIPTTTHALDPAVEHSGDVLTIFARDAYGWEFNLTRPGPAKLAELSANGWDLRVERGSRPHYAVLSRARAYQAGDLRRPSFAATMTYNGETAGRLAVCEGDDCWVESAGAAMAAAINTQGADDSIRASVLAEVRTQLGAGANPNYRTGNNAVVALAAQRLHWRAVSVLLTAGADPNGAFGNNRRVPHLVGRNSDINSTAMLEVLRHFLGALAQTGQVDSFTGWNASADVGRPLDALNTHGANTDATRTIHRLLYERGARCASPGSKPRCQVPATDFTALLVSDAGPLLNLFAPDAYGLEFNFAPPDAAAVSVLARSGWELDLRTTSRPHRAVLARTRGFRVGDSPPFLTLTVTRDGETAGVFRVCRGADDCWNAAAGAAMAAAAGIFGTTPSIRMSVAEEVRTQLNLGGNPNIKSGNNDIAALAAHRRHAVAVSLLVAAGADPGGRSGNRRILHHVARDSGALGAEMLDVLRHFLGALGVSGQVESFTHWNAGSDIGRPLDAVQTYGGNSDEAREIQRLLYERGARCLNPGNKTHCQIPMDDHTGTLSAVAQGETMFLTAPDEFGWEFDIAAPDASVAPMLASLGWNFRVETNARPHRAVMERLRDARNSDERRPSFSVTLSRNGETTGIFRVCPGENDCWHDAGGPIMAQAILVFGETEDIRASVAAVVRTQLSALANPNHAPSQGALVALAAQRRHAVPVSLLIAAGADPNGSSGNRRALHHIARESGAHPAESLAVLRHFIGALGVSGQEESFTHWNAGSDFGRPLDMLNQFGGNLQTSHEMRALLYERGARCASPGNKRRCQIPLVESNAQLGFGKTGPLLTVNARDWHGWQFNLSAPDSAVVASLAAGGWQFQLMTATRPHRAILSRERTLLPGDAPGFLRLTMLSEDGEPAAILEMMGDPRLAPADIVGGELTYQQAEDFCERWGRIQLSGGTTAGNIRFCADIVPNVPRHPSNPASGGPDFTSGRCVLEPPFIGSWFRCGPIFENIRLCNRQNMRGVAGSSGCVANSNSASCPVTCQPCAAGEIAFGDDCITNFADQCAATNPCGPGQICLDTGVREDPLDKICLAAETNDAASEKLAAAVRVEGTSESIRASVAAEVRTQLADNADPSYSAAEGAVLALAAQRRNWLAVSILMTAGAAPDGRAIANRGVLHHVGRDSDNFAPEMEQVLRHFLAGMGQAGRISVFDAANGWNATPDIGRPLDALQNFAPADSDSARNIHALLYERGARCADPGEKIYCQIPLLSLALTLTADYTGNVLAGFGPTALFASRDDYGWQFEYALPDPAALNLLAATGWNLALQTMAPPHGAVLSRPRTEQRALASSAMFMLTLTHDGETAAVFNISATLAVPGNPLLHLNSSGEGEISGVGADGRALANGDEVEFDELLTIIATPPLWGHVSAWGGECAGSPTGIYEGPRICTVSVAAGVPAVSVSVGFAVGRLPPEVVDGTLNQAQMDAICGVWGTHVFAGAGFLFCRNVTPNLPRHPAGFDFLTGACIYTNQGGYYHCRPIFEAIRECNRVNMRGVTQATGCSANHNVSCPVVCEACAEGELAFGDDCLPVRDQCDPNPCAAGQTCLDSETGTMNSLNQICVGGETDDAASEKLAAAVRTTGADSTVRASVAAAVVSLLAENADPNYQASEGAVLALAAQRRNWLAVSILLTAGAHPDGRAIANRGVLHHVGRNSDQFSADMLEVLRHFLGGMEESGRFVGFESVNGWNATADTGRPLDALNSNAANTAASREIHRLLYAHGARCANPGNKPYCQIGAVTETLTLSGNGLGIFVVMSAPDAYGLQFDLSTPSPELVSELSANGWQLRLETNSRPHRARLSRTRTFQGGDAPRPSFDMTLTRDGETAGLIRVCPGVDDCWNSAAGNSLISAVQIEGSSADIRLSIRRRVEFQLILGANPNAKTGNDAALALAAQRRHWQVVSVLLTAGADADSRAIANRSVLHHVGRNSDQFSAEMLQVLRHFIVGLSLSGQTDSFTGWNAGSDVGRPLEALNARAANTAASRDIHRLLYERGARCASPGNKTYCQIPSVFVQEISPGSALTAPDEFNFEYDFSLPDSAVAASLSANGWGLELQTVSRPHRAILTRSRNFRQGDSRPIFTVTLTREGEAAAAFSVCPNAACWNGSAGSALGSAVGVFAETPAIRFSVLQEVRNQLRSFANPNSRVGNDDVVAIAAHRRHWEAVSVLITAGADSRGNSINNRRVPHHVARASDTHSAEMLNVLRHFLGALEESGQRSVFTHWNAGADVGRPLDALQTHAAETAATDEIHRLLYERGARCLSPGNKARCQVPQRGLNLSVTSDRFGGIPESARTVTVYAPDAYGWEFEMRGPESDSDAVALLDASGWELSLHSDTRPHHGVLWRTRDTRLGDETVRFQLTILSGSSAVGVWDVAASVAIAEGAILHVGSTGPGEVSAFSDGSEARTGSDVRRRSLVTLIAVPSSFRHHVSGWGGECAGSPTGAEDGTRTCVFTVGLNPASVVANVTFAAGRLPPDIIGDDLNPAQVNVYCGRWGNHTTRQLGSETVRLCENITRLVPRHPFNATGFDYSSGRCMVSSPTVGWYHCKPMFEAIRECNRVNAAGVAQSSGCLADSDSSACPVVCEECGADELGFGDRCRLDLGDQCADNPCRIGSACADPDPWRGNTLTELCGVGGGNISANEALAEALRNLTGSAAAAEVHTQIVRGASPNYHASEGAVLALAAHLRQWGAVSVLLTAGAYPDGRAVAGRGVLHHVGRESDNYAAEMLEVLRHFLAGLNLSGQRAVFEGLDGWNDGSIVGRPLEALNANASDNSSSREIRQLLYERGARCASAEGKPFCQLPRTDYNTLPNPVGTGRGITPERGVGAVLTVVRDGYGWEFDFSTPSAEVISELTLNGWALEVRTDSRPHRAILSRTRAHQAGDSYPSFAITVSNADGETTGIIGSCLSGSCWNESAGASLAAAVRTEGGSDNESARVSVFAAVRTQLAAEANPNYQASEGAVLPLAAQRRNWEAVSVLITAGANLDGRAIANRSALHHVGRASDLYAADMLEVLRHFLGGLHESGRMEEFDNLDGWNSSTDLGRPLDALETYGSASEATDEIHRLLYERGARCASPGSKSRCQIPGVDHNVAFPNGAGAVLTVSARDDYGWEFDFSTPSSLALAELNSNGWDLRVETGSRPHMAVLSRTRAHRPGDSRPAFAITMTHDGETTGIVGSCLSGSCWNESAGASLAAAVGTPGTDADADLRASVLAEVRTQLAAEANPNYHASAGAVLALAAFHRNWQAVSVLITAGANLDGRAIANRAVLHHVGRNSDQFAPQMLEVLRHFLGGLEDAGRIGEFNTADGWNISTDLGRPLDALQNNGGNTEETREIHRLLYERGARCASPGNKQYCQLPVVESAALGPNAPGAVLTFSARDAFGWEFDLSLPDSGVLSSLAVSGWTLALSSAERPHRAVLSRSRSREGDDAAALLTLTMSHSGGAVLLFAAQATLGHFAADLCGGGVCDSQLLTETFRAYDANGADAVLASVSALLGNGANPNAEANDGSRPLGRAGFRGYPRVVSVLLAAGAGADSPYSGLVVPQLAARGFQYPHRGLGLEARGVSVLRHFIAGLNVRGIRNFNWNRSEGELALELMADNAGNAPGAGSREMAALIYERGGRCDDASAHALCQIPAEDARRRVGGEVGAVMTLTARDFGGDEFNLELPDADALALLAESGWTLRVESDARPHIVVAGRSRMNGEGDASAVFTVTARAANIALNNGAVVRRYHVSLYNESLYDIADNAEELNALLLAEVFQVYNEATASSVASSVAALLAAGASPNAAENGSSALGRAGFRGHPLVVSVLLTAGADPNTTHGGRTALQQTGRNLSAFTPARALALVRHFISGLQIARENDSNTPDADWGSGTNSPLRLAAGFAENRGLENHPDSVEFQALIFERGGRCDSMTSFHGSSRFCQIPAQTDNVEVGGEVGNAHIITARDFGGDEFNLELPDSDSLATLAASGWDLRLETGFRPHRVVAARSRMSRAGDASAVFTVTARAANIAMNNGAVVRVYNVSLGNDALYDLEDPTERLNPLLLAETFRAYNANHADAVLASVSALLADGADPNAQDNGSHALGRAAFTGYPRVVSVLLAAGADPDSLHANRNAAQQAARGFRYGHEGAGLDTRGVSILRHFIAGLNVRGIRNFNWNRSSNGVALNLAADEAGNAPGAGSREIAALIYERGGRCGGASTHPICQIPVQDDNVEVGGEAGTVHTITARDFGGDEFNLALPDSDSLATLAASGWTLRLESDARPHRVYAGRSRASQTGDASAAFTVTARATNSNLNNGAVVRVYNVSLYNDALYDVDVSAEAPDAPINFAAAQIADVEFGILLSWEVPSSGGSAITNWVLQSAATDAGNCPGHSFAEGDYSAVSAPELTADSVSLSYFPPPGERDKCLSFRLAAQNAVGIGPYSVGESLTLSVSALSRLRTAAENGDAAGVESALAEIELGSRRDLGNAAGIPLVPAAAQARHAEVVSVLVAGGVNANGANPGNGRNVAHLVARDSDNSAPEMLAVLRHFIAGLHAAGANNSFDGWNASAGVGLPLSALQANASKNTNDLAAKDEIHWLFYERGARCQNAGNDPYCQIPAQDDAREVGGEVGDVHTITARDFGGDEFNLELPGALRRGALLESGWTLRLESGSRPHRVVAARGRASRTGDASAVFTVTARAGDGEVVRVYHVSLYNDAIYDLDVAAPTAPEAPPNFSATQIADVEFGVLLSWDVPAQGGSAITNWVLQSAATVAADCAAHSFAEDDYGAVSDSGLTANSLSLSYFPPEDARDKCLGFRLAAENSVGVGPYSVSENLTLSLSALSRLRTAAENGDAAGAASALAEIELGSRRDLNNAAGIPLVAAAAQERHAELISVLVAGGVNPNGAFSDGRNAAHLVARNTDSYAPEMLEVLRHFLAGLNESGNSFDGWNASADIGRPLNALQEYASQNQNDLAAKREIHSLLYERGARCESPGNDSYCQIPLTSHSSGWLSSEYGVDVLTLTARDAYGWEFDLLLPDAGVVSSLGDSGWGLELNSSRPHRAVLSRTRARLASDSSALLTLTMTHSGDAVGLFAAEVSLTGDFDQCAAAQCGANEMCADPDVSVLNSEAEICSCVAGWTRVNDVCRYPPEAPVGVAAALSGELDSDSPAVELSWEAPNTEGEDVEGYIVWRDSAATDFAGCSSGIFDANGFATELTRTAGNVVSHSDPDVEYGNCYGYALAARTSATVGARSGAAVVYVRGVPGPVGGLAATVNADDDVVLSWGAPEILRASELTGYKIFRKAGAESFRELDELSSDVLSYVDMTAPSGEVLLYRVRAESDAGPGQELSELDYAQAEKESRHECLSGYLPTEGNTALEFCQRLGSACSEDGSANPPVHSGTGRYWRRGGNGDEAVCGCENSETHFQLGSECVLRTGRLTGGGLGLRELCRAFEGMPRDSGGEIVCSGLDAAETFCLLGSREALPCEGLLKHARECNLLNRFALDAFLCGSVCPEGQYAAGGKCCVPNGVCE